MNEKTKILTISLELPFELSEKIYDVLDELGGISRSAFIRQSIQEKLTKLEAGKGEIK